MSKLVITVIGCIHEPKKFKKIGIIFGKLHEILVCDSCKNDPDFSGFKDEVIEN